MGPGLPVFKSCAGAGSSQAPGMSGRRRDALPEPGRFSSPCRMLQRWHRAHCCSVTWALLVLAGCMSSSCLLQASAKTLGHLRSYCRSLHASSFMHLYTAPLEPPFLELTPPQPCFQDRKDSSTVCLCSACAAVCRGCVWGQGAGCCLLSTQGTRCPCNSANPHVASNLYLCLARKRQPLLLFLGALIQPNLHFSSCC